MKMRWLRSKKGAVSPALLLSMLLCIALIIILLIQIFNFAVLGSVKGNAGYIARDAGSLIEVGYSAPETLKAAYKVPFGSDGYPRAGSFLLDGERNRVCVSPHSEDEMFGLISDAALAGFVGGVATKGFVATQRVWKFRGIRWVGRHIPGAKIATFTGKVINKVAPKIYKKLTSTFGKLGIKKATQEFGRTLVRKTGRLILKAIGRDSSTAFTATASESLMCGPVPCGKIAGYIMAIMMFALDVVFSILPMVAMERLGHSASEEEINKIKCYPTTAPLNHAEPRNCKTKLEDLEFKELAGDTPILKDIPGSVLFIPTCTDEFADIDKEQGGIKSESDFCYSCPNYFVSQPDGEELQWKITFAEDLGEGITITLGDILFTGPQFVCASFTAAGGWLGSLCSLSYWTAIIGKLYTDTDWFVNLVLGANILPRDEYYYMAFPSRIDIEKIYNTEDGTSELTIIHAE
jgi:hypothetical protein